MSSIPTSIAGGIQAGYGTATGLQRAIFGDAALVSFMRNKQVLVQFDATLQETHAIEAAPTAFPIEDGQTVGDHIIIAPTELQLVGVVTDSPINNRTQLIKEAFTSAANVIAGPLGVIATAAATVGLAAKYGSTSPSFATYETLRRLAEGSTDPKNPLAPTPFDVITRLRTYPNMVIKSLQVPRDATTGNALVFTIALTQLRIVAAQSLTLQQSAIPSLASVKQKLAESDDGYIAGRYGAGVKSADNVAGAVSNFAKGVP